MNELITKIETINPKLSDAIVLFFNTKECRLDEVVKMLDIVEKKFPNNEVIALPDAMSLEDFEKATLIEFLEKTIKRLIGEEI